LLTVTRGNECGGKVHLMTHSMGAYVLRYAIQEMRKHTPGVLPRIFDSIFLMAADEDADAFARFHKLAHLSELCRQVHVYCNDEDRALAVSDLTKHNPVRLGSIGPLIQYGAHGVNVIDVGEVVDGIVEHTYYLDNPQTIDDVSEIMAGAAPDEASGREYVPGRGRYVLGRRCRN